VYNLGEKIRDIFRFFTDIEKKIYAMNDMIPYDMLNDMLLIKLKYINSGNLDAEVNKVFAKYKNRRDIAVLFLLAGQLYYEAGVYDKSCENFLKALPGINGKVKLSRNAGLMYMKKRAFKQSLEMFCKYAALAPDVSDAYYNRGEVEYLTGDTGMAKKDFEKAVEIDGNNAAKEYLLKIK
jgi:tetratricopeptide (TPR) repeat protein